MTLKTIDQIIEVLKALAEEQGYYNFVSGRLVVGAEWHKGTVIYYVNDKRSTEDQVRAAIDKQRAGRVHHA
jgi:hypothetical protein